MNDGGYVKDILFIRLDGPTPFVTILYRKDVCKFHVHFESSIFISLNKFSIEEMR
jgi:hypothetical protein